MTRAQGVLRSRWVGFLALGAVVLLLQADLALAAAAGPNPPSAAGQAGLNHAANTIPNVAAGNPIVPGNDPNDRQRSKCWWCAKGQVLYSFVSSIVW